jgi:hypothetical protein
MPEEPIKLRLYDGSIVTYDQKKVEESICRAQERADMNAYKELAGELAGVVTIFLRKSYGQGRVVEQSDLHDMVEKVLRETGNLKTTKAYMLSRKEKEEHISIDLYLNGDNLLEVLTSEESPLEVIASFEGGAYIIFREDKSDPGSNYIYKMTYTEGIPPEASNDIINKRLKIAPDAVMHDEDSHLADSQERFDEVVEFLESKKIDHYFLVRNKRGKIVFARGYSSEEGRVINIHRLDIAGLRKLWKNV